MDNWFGKGAECGLYGNQEHDGSGGRAREHAECVRVGKLVTKVLLEWTPWA